MKRDERFIFLIGQARNRLFTRLDQALVDVAGVTATQSGALYYLMANDGCSLTDLSRALSLDVSAVTGMIDRLGSKGFVTRRSKPADRRAVNVFLTEDGKAAAMKCLGVTKKYNDSVKEGLSEDEVECFSRILQKIINRFS